MNTDRANTEWEQYQSLIELNPELIRAPAEAGIEILTDLQDIEVVKNARLKQLAEQGLPESWANLGLVFEDNYIAVLREPVRWCETKTTGTYLRILEKPIGHQGVVMFPVIDNQIVLIRVFRHAIRDWLWELPRGFGDSGSPIDDAKTELQEEIGAKVGACEIVGTVHANSGLFATGAKLIYAELDHFGTVSSQEAINRTRTVNASELGQMICDGEISDAYSLSAIQIVQARGLGPFAG